MKTVYRETFASGPGAWTTGKDAETGHWHRNLYGRRGAPVPLAWQPSGGRRGPYATASSPWYFDDNHGEFAWLHLAFFVNRSALIDLEGQDLRNAEITLALRGRNFQRQGTQLFFWMQGTPATYNWALTAYPIAASLDDGQWHDEKIILHNDESRWRPMGLLNGGLARKIRVFHSLSAADGSLNDLLNGQHINFGFLLCGLDPNALPSGSIDLEEIAISVP